MDQQYILLEQYLRSKDKFDCVVNEVSSSKRVYLYNPTKLLVMHFGKIGVEIKIEDDFPIYLFNHTDREFSYYKFEFYWELLYDIIEGKLKAPEA